MSKIALKKLYISIISFCIVTSLLFTPHLALADSTLSDNFDDNRLDPSKWISVEVGGPIVTEVNNIIEMTIPADSSDPFLFQGDIISACVLTGDFDIQVDYQLLNWPAKNGVRMGLSTFSTSTGESAEVLRISWGPNDPSRSFNPAMPEVYLTNPNRVVIATTDFSGKLRLTRVGNVATGYYFDSVEGWKELSSSAQTGDIHLYLAAFSTNMGPLGDAFGDQEVKVAFDNLVVQGKKICRDRYNPANPAIF